MASAICGLDIGMVDPCSHHCIVVEQPEPEMECGAHTDPGLAGGIVASHHQDHA